MVLQMATSFPDLFRLMGCEQIAKKIYFSSAFLHTLPEYLIHFFYK